MNNQEAKPKDVRTERIEIRLTSVAKDLIRKKAHEAGQSASDYMTSAALGAHGSFAISTAAQDAIKESSPANVSDFVSAAIVAYHRSNKRKEELARAEKERSPLFIRPMNMEHLAANHFGFGGKSNG
jgi:uncharacterized protein (DUF1778 family)